MTNEMHISARTLQKWGTTGLLPSIKIGGKIYYMRADIVELLNKMRELSIKKRV